MRVEELFELTNSEARNRLISCNDRILLKDLKVFDLTKNVAKSNTGVYILYDVQNNPLYVGKTSSKGFLERLPAHFDSREDAWHNHFIKKIKYKEETFEQVIERIFLSIKLQIVAVDEKNKELCNKLESVLNNLLRPQLNPKKRYADLLSENIFIENFPLSVIR